MVFGFGFLQVSKKNFLLGPLFSALYHWLHSFWATESGSRVFPSGARAQSSTGHRDGFRFVSCPSVLPIVCTPLQRSAARLEQLYRVLSEEKGEGQLNSIRSPTDHFTYQRQVNPFIVMKWGSVMYYGCERLNPVLSFLWGRQIRAHIRSVQRSPRTISQILMLRLNSTHLRRFASVCVCMFFMTHICTSICVWVLHISAGSEQLCSDIWEKSGVRICGTRRLIPFKWWGTAGLSPRLSQV